MNVFGNMYTIKIAVAAGNGAEQDLSGIVSTEKLIKVMPDSANVHILLTPASSTATADASDYLLPTIGDEFLAGRGLDRIALWNTGGTTANVYVAVLF